MQRSLNFFLGLALVSCIDSQSPDPSEAITATETSNATVAPTTTIVPNPPVRSGIRMALWRQSIDTGATAFWPSGARRVQVIITAGDRGDRLTGGRPTAYVWIIRNGSSVYKIWRVQTAHMEGPAGFMTVLGKHYATAQTGIDTGASHVILGSLTTPGPRGPQIMPDGSGEFTQTMVSQTLVTAAAVNQLADVTAREYPIQ